MFAKMTRRPLLKSKVKISLTLNFKLSLIFSLFLFNWAQASGMVEMSLSSYLQNKHLPAKLKSVKLGVTPKTKVLQILGPASKEKNNGELLFYDLSGHRFDTTIEIKKGIVHSLYYRFKKGELPFAKIKNLIDAKILQTALRSDSKTARVNHSAGRELQIRLEKEQLLLTISKVENAQVISYYQSL